MICSSKVCKWVISVCSLLVVELIQDANPSELFVDFTYIEGAAAKGAFCLDGTLPGYHFHPGHGSGANSWLVDLEGGGWCHDIKTCVERKTNGHGFGSSEYMNKSNAFNGILSNRSQDNPDFFNWNRARVRYCDGASFAGEGVNKAAGLQFRGQRIYRAAMDALMSKGMRHADQALLSGCSAGGLAVILHCDHFSNLFPSTTRVKCLSDAGLFMDAIDISGRHSMRNLLFKGVVSLQGVKKILPHSCTSHLDATSCFFPQNLINYVRTPLFILNAAYDISQIGLAVAPNASDPDGNWTNCKSNITECSQLQIHILQKFRKRMIKAVKSFGAASQNGVFINSCFTHCQAVFQVTWLSDNPPMVGNKGISVAVGDWYFGRSSVNKIDCPYPCDKTCYNHQLNTLTNTSSDKASYSIQLLKVS